MLRWYNDGQSKQFNVTWTQCYKTFFFRNLQIIVIVPGKSFQQNVMFLSKARAYPSEATFTCDTLVYAQALPTNVKLDSKGLPGTIPLAY